MGKGKAKLKGKTAPGGSSKQEERRIKSLLKKQAHRSKNYACREEVAFALQLEEQQWSIRIMDGDGNCMFRSISDQLYGNDSRFAEVRTAVVAYMRKNAEHFSLFMEDDEPFSEYIRDMSENGTWGGNHELFAASQVYNAMIHVHQYDAPTFVFEHAKPSRSLHLSYHGEHHYNSLHSTSPTRKDPVVRSDNIDASTVAQAVPWCSQEAVAEALAQSKSVSSAIELLMTTHHSDPVDKEMKSVATILEKIEISNTPSVMDSSKIPKKVLSKKEKRMLKKGISLKAEMAAAPVIKDESRIGSTISV